MRMHLNLNLQNNKRRGALQAKRKNLYSTGRCLFKSAKGPHMIMIKKLTGGGGDYFC